MRTSMLFGYLILLLARSHGRVLDMQLHAAQLGKEEEPSDLKWQRPPLSSSSAGGRSAETVSRAPSERHLTSTASAAEEEDGEVKKTRAHRGEVAQRLTNQDYAGPSGHSPNHHRTIRCGPC